MKSGLKIIVVICSLLLCGIKSFAAVEPYENFIKGAIRQNDSLLVKDEKFKNPLFLWSDITNISVKNTISLKILDEQAISQSFRLNLKIRVEYFSSPAQVVPTKIDSVKLSVNYKTGAGQVYQSTDSYSFTDGYYVKVYVLDIQSPELGSSIPDIFQLTSTIVINRKYNFVYAMPVMMTGTLINDDTQLQLNWTPLSSGEEYDIEWVTLDKNSDNTTVLASMVNHTFAGSEDVIAEFFKNNATRITTAVPNYLVSLLSSADVILVRIRQVSYTVDGLRNEGKWFYKQDSPVRYTAWNLSWHESKMNWQYAASFAEEGKKKEVVTYFDGTLRGRQTVTLNNADNVAVVQENIYDQYGRAAASILPAPVKDAAANQNLHFFQNFNRNAAGHPYSFQNLESAFCETLPQALNTASGASRYYSANNDFKNDALRTFNKYIPDAAGFPLSVTQYTADNTGKIRLQGGVGPAFQPGVADSRTTKYYYAKPQQWELDRLFGNDAGYASHYLKNMVMDANKQISISYLNAAGKTVATALTGASPANVSPLGSMPTVKSDTSLLISGSDFSFNSTGLNLSATTTYVASVAGTGKLKYNIEQLISRYPGTAFKPCSNCYYELKIVVKNDCREVMFENSNVISIGSQTADSTRTAMHVDSVSVNFAKPGEYYVTFDFALSKDVMKNYADEFVRLGQLNGSIKKETDFILFQLGKVNFQDCLADCKTAVEKLGSLLAFKTMFNGKLNELGIDTPAYDSFITGLHASLLSTAQTLQSGCGASVSICEQYRPPMLSDVSPGGQYALFDASGTALEPAINVLALGFRHGVFNVLSSGDQTYKDNLVTLENGTVSSPYDSSFTLADLVKYWKPEWAELFLHLHPEYCKLQFCNANTVSANWDEKIKLVPTAAGIGAATGGLSYSDTNNGWLLPADPFFKSTGSGYIYVDSMAADLEYYSSRVLKLNTKVPSAAVKGLSKFVDYQLYCADTTGVTNQNVGLANKWGNCAKVTACRVIDREWEMYRDLYLELKQKYFEKRRRETTCFSVCEVNKPIPLTAPVTPPSCAYTLDLTLRGTQTAPDTFVQMGYTMYIKHIHKMIPGSPDVEPPYDPNTLVDYFFYPCLKVLVGSKTRYFYNVWDVHSLEQVAIPCVYHGPIYGDGYAGNPKRFYANGAYYNTRDYYTIYDYNDLPLGQEPPIYLNEPGQMRVDFYECLTVLSYGNIPFYEEFTNVWLKRNENVPSSYWNWYFPYWEYGYKNTEQSPKLWYAGYSPAVQNLPENKFEFKLRSGSGASSKGDSWIQKNAPATLKSSAALFSFPPGCHTTDFAADGYYDQYGTYASVYYISGTGSCNTSSVTVKLYRHRGAQYDFIGNVLIPAGETGVYVEFNNAGLPPLDGTDLFVCGENPCLNPEPPNCPALLKTKVSRFGAPDRSDIADKDPTEIYNDQEVQLHQLITSSCDSNAVVWMERLAPGLVGKTQGQKDLLKAKLIEMCNRGGDLAHPIGSSSMPPTPYATSYVLVNGVQCRDFGEVIKAALGVSSFTNALNPWLIESPYPYSPPQQAVEKTVSNTSQAICTQLAALRPGGYSDAQFYTHLQNTYGTAMRLSYADFQVLLKGCGNCKYILDKDLVLPQFLQPDSKTCISRSEYTAAVSALLAQFSPALSPDSSNYETIVSNGLNFKWGFSLNYDKYKTFADGSDARLCNELPYTEIAGPAYTCEKSLIELAAGIGRQQYAEYIAAERLKFNNAYINTCAGARAAVKLFATQQVYHYTLYYYDQAGNLLRTVPPEGVHPLSDIELDRVAKSRDFYRENNCAYNGPTGNANKTTALQSLSNTLAYNGNAAVELWMYQDDLSARQVIAVTPDVKYMFQACVNGSLLSVDVYTLQQSDPNSVSIVLSNHVTANIAAIQPASPWTHIVVQGANLSTGTLQLWVNGKLYAPVSGAPSAGCGWTIGTGPLVLPENIAALKHLRLYSGRLMTASEIRQNAESACFKAFDAVSPLWYRFGVPAAGSGTTIAENSTLETQFKPLYPGHTLATTYTYNSSNQVIRQQSPDGGTSRFWYDLLSRLIISQNAKQSAADKYSYTVYDVLGRVTEVGEKQVNNATLKLAGQLEAPGYLDNTFYTAFLASGSNSQLTQTLYDVAPAATGGIPSGLVQQNLRKRVAASVYRETPASTDINASYYDYDLAGNVKTLYQQVNGLGVKRLGYEYDLASGKVNFLSYQDGQPDRFYYAYKYDSENRLREAWTSVEANVIPYGIGSTLDFATKKQDAGYSYYLHGPLARTELGNAGSKLQGLDYAYTLQGWLKGVNGNALVPGTEQGRDGDNGVGRDVMAYSLGYYPGDYTPIGGSGSGAYSMAWQTGGSTGNALYNGNISTGTVAIKGIGSDQPVGYSYGYDQLNRLVRMRQHGLSNSTTTWNSSSINSGYKEDYTYDGNGNILGLQRYAAGGSAMDRLGYVYNRDGYGQLLNNRLSQLRDTVSGVSNTGELDGISNYSYDAIGNLTADSKEGISAVDWSVYGKIRSITKSGGVLSYGYDPTGNRVSKTLAGLTTWYVRDAQGNQLGVYDNAGGTVKWREQDLYGSSRLGMWKPDTALVTGAGSAIWNMTSKKRYELNNHLGNVLAVVSDNRNLVGGFHQSDVLSAQDYYPFGMIQPDRNYSSLNYRFGFNGKENDNEVKGTGNQQDYGMRIYDPRVGKFLSVDPLQAHYPELTPYQFASNSPIANIDLDGLESSNSNKVNNALIGMPVATKLGEKVTEGLAKQAMERAVEKGVETMVKQPKANPLSLFSRSNILLAIWYTFTSSNDTYADKQLYQQAEEKEFKDQTANETWAREHHRMDYPDGVVDKKDDSRDVVYRGGSFTPTNFTPRPGKDDGEGPKSGLSTFRSPLQATQGQGGRAQVIDLGVLRNMGFKITETSDGHVGIRPPTRSELKEWAKTRGEKIHYRTVMTMAARIGEVKTPKK